MSATIRDSRVRDMVSPHVPSRLAYLSPKGAPMFFHGPGCALDRTKDKKRMGPHVLRR